MMAKKLAGFFSVLGIIVFLGTWLYQSWVPNPNATMEAMNAEKAWEIGIYLAAAFFLLGLFVATLGIALVQEVLAETRSRSMEKKFRARTAYERVIGIANESPPTESAPEAG